MYPILFKTPWFNVYAYGTLLALGYAVGTFWILREAGKAGISREAVFDMLLLQMVVGVLGSRFLYLVEYAPDKLTLRDFFNFEGGGLTFYGAVISSFLFDLIYLKWQRIPFWQVMDCVGFGLPLGITLARLGCFLNGCCHGGPTAMPWGVVFPKVGPHPVHPTQVYESLAGLSIFLILQRFRHKQRNHGEIFLSCMALYGALRFLIEIWRADNPVFLMGMSLSQVVGIGAIIVSHLIWLQIRKRPDMRVLPPDTDTPLDR